MPFKSEKQRRYLWANEPEIARDWTDTYGSRIHKNEGGIMDMASEGDLYHTFENYRKGKQVTVPTSFQARSHSTPVHLAYITDDEAGILRALKPDTPHEGPMGIPNYNDYDPTGGGYGRATSGEQMSGMESRGGQTEQHRADARSLGYTPQEVRDIKGGAQQAAAMGQPKNLGINFSVPGQNFMRNIHPLRWAGNLIDNPFVSGAWSFLTSPLSGMSNMRGGMTQKEYELARQQRIANKSIQNILGRDAPITEMTQSNLANLYKQAGITSGFVPDVGSTPQKRAIAKDFKREGEDLYLENPSEFYLASLADKMGITGTQAYEDFPPNVALSKQMGSLQAGAIPYETFGADKPVDKYAWDTVVGEENPYKNVIAQADFFDFFTGGDKEEVDVNIYGKPEIITHGGKTYEMPSKVKTTTGQEQLEGRALENYIKANEDEKQFYRENPEMMPKTWLTGEDT